MARIGLKDLKHSYVPEPSSPDDYAIKRLDLEWQDGGAYALLGPSGCGKTTLLNIISGLVTPSHGRVLFDDRDVTQLPPSERNIAQVFQFPVVYDTMSVFDNLAFPLRNRHVDDAHVKAASVRSPNCSNSPISCITGRLVFRPTSNRSSRWGAAWYARTSTSSCSTNR